MGAKMHLPVPLFVCSVFTNKIRTFIKISKY